MIFPLPVKKNKYGETVADISVGKYYRQIMEEVLEAHENAVITNYLFELEGDADLVDDWENDEAEELADIITCCVTRFAVISGDIYDWVDFYVKAVAKTHIEIFGGNFYVDLSSSVMRAYHIAQSENIGEEAALIEIIYLCIGRLEYLGYDESKRQKLYQAVNEKNKQRGYFED